MGGGRSTSDGGAFAVIFVMLLVVGVVITYFWWIVGAGALVGLYFVGRAVAREVQKRRELAEQKEYELKRRADRQHRWLLTGDSRGIYGQQGAAAMRDVAPQPSLPDGEDAPTQNPAPIARLAATSDEVAALVNDKPDAWGWALFTSILVQRTTPLLPRLRDSELGFSPAATTRLYTAAELATAVVGLIDDMLSTAHQLDSFMTAPAFMASFYGPADGAPPDAEAIKHIAHRTMDYHDRFLELSERCRSLSAPSEYTDILADCARLLDFPLQSYREFIGELVDVIESLPQVLQHATDDVDMGAIVLDIDLDGDGLRSRIFKRLDAINPSR